MSLPYLQPYLGLSNGLNTLHAAGAGGAVGGWVELGRYTAGSTTTNLSVSSLPDKRYYMILENVLVSSDTSHNQITFNSDTGSNYAWRTSSDGGADATGTSQTYIENQSVDATPHFLVGYLANYASKEKLLMYHTIKQNTAGAGSAPTRKETVAKWANTSNAFNKWNTYKNTAAAGSELVILGYDPADTHTNNFWEELASVEASGTVTSLDTGTFTAKKYLWIQCFMKPSGSPSFSPIFNNDTGSNYAFRYSDNGGTDATNTSQTDLGTLNQGYSNTFTNIFVINNQSNEKLCLVHGINQTTAGAGYAPARRELVAKWANTSNQITSFKVSGSSIASGSIIKVWGAN